MDRQVAQVAPLSLERRCACELDERVAPRATALEGQALVRERAVLDAIVVVAAVDGLGVDPVEEDVPVDVRAVETRQECTWSSTVRAVSVCESRGDDRPPARR